MHFLYPTMSRIVHSVREMLKGWSPCMFGRPLHTITSEIYCTTKLDVWFQKFWNNLKRYSTTHKDKGPSCTRGRRLVHTFTSHNIIAHCRRETKTFRSSNEQNDIKWLRDVQELSPQRNAWRRSLPLSITNLHCLLGWKAEFDTGCNEQKPRLCSFKGHIESIPSQRGRKFHCSSRLELGSSYLIGNWER